MPINIFRKYTPEETCQMIGCDMKTLLPILKEMSKKRCSVWERGETYLVAGGEVKVIKYRLENQ